MSADGYPHRATRHPATLERPGRMAHEDRSNVSSSKPTPGLRERHSRRCASHRGERCNCTPTWEASVFDKSTGRKLRHSAKTKTAAKLWRQGHALVALRRGELRAPTENARKVGPALAELVAGMRDGTVLDRSGRRYRPSTIRNYQTDIRSHLTPGLGHLRLTELRRADIQRAIDRMHADGLAGSTIRNKIEPLRVLYRRAAQDEEVAVNPTTQLRLPALPSGSRRVADPERVADLLDALPDEDRALWATAFYAGLRMGELRALRWRDVDFDAGRICVDAGWDDVEGEQGTKTAAGMRTVPLVGRLRSELARHKLATGRGADDLCFGTTGTLHRSARRFAAGRSRLGAGGACRTRSQALDRSRSWPRRAPTRSIPDAARGATYLRELPGSGWAHPQGGPDRDGSRRHPHYAEPVCQGGARLGAGSSEQARRLSGRQCAPVARQFTPNPGG